MLKTCLCAVIVLLQACAATAPRPAQQPSFFADAHFAPPAEPVDAGAVLAMSREMQRFVDVAIAGPMKRKGLERALHDALYDRNRLQLEYDGATTRTASEAFALRTGNCLSLVLMTAAIAQRLQLPVIYQQVFVPNSWTRSNGIAFASQHVNLVLGKRPFDGRTMYQREDILTVDFLPSEAAAQQRSRTISETTVIAMYFNNRAAEELARDRLDAAYWWARTAIAQSPQFLAAYNTLGVVYLQRGLLTEAERVLQYVIAQEPANTLALSNLVGVHRAAGRVEEAAALQAELADIDPTPPFYFADLGMAAFAAGDYAGAKRRFEQELRRDAYAHESHYWLAIAEQRLGNARAAERQLALAIDSSSTLYEKGIYVAKLDYLRGLHATP